MFRETRDLTIPPDRVRTLHSEPLTLIPTQGTVRCIVFEGMVARKLAGAAYTVPDDVDLVLRFDSEPDFCGCLGLKGFLDSADEETRWVDSYRFESGISSTPLPANTPLITHIVLQDVTGGDAEIRLRLFYRVLEL